MDEHGATAPLTDNEKAATFIGYDPLRCKPGCPFCAINRGLGIYPTHTVPDMSKPENYMRALEALVKSGVEVKLFGQLERPALLWGCCLNSPALCGNTEADDPASAVVEGLAALYDAQSRPAVPPQPKAKE